MTYTGHTLYRFLTALCVLLVGLFLWQLWQRWDWGALLFVGVAIWSAWRSFALMTSKIELMQDRVRLLAFGSSPQAVEFRQLVAVHEEGRGLKSILLLYHPHLENGLIAHDEERTLALPAVNQHEALLAALTAQVQL